MSDKTKMYMSGKQWKSLGPMEQEPTDDGSTIGEHFLSAKGKAGAAEYEASKAGKRGQFDKSAAVNRPGANENSDTGFSYRPFEPHTFVGQANQTLGNPYYTSSMDDFTAGLSQFEYFNDVISQPGAARVRLAKALVINDHAKGLDAQRLGQKPDNNWMISHDESESNVHVIKAAQIALRNQFPIPTLAEAAGEKISEYTDGGFYGDGRKKMKQLSPEELVRQNKNISEGPVKSTFPKKDADVDWAKFAKDFAAEVSLARSRTHTIPRADGSKAQYKAAYAVIAAKGQEKLATDAIAKVPAGSIVMPSKNIFAQVAGQRNNALVRKNFDDTAQIKKANETVIAKSDMVIVYGTDKPGDRVNQDAGLAAKAGKLAKYYENGVEVPIKEARKQLITARIDDDERAMNTVINGMNMDAASPQGRIALKALHNEENGFLSDDEIKPIMASGMNLRDISDICESEEGRLHLEQEKGFSAKSIRLLSDKKVLTDANSCLVDRVKQCSKARVHIITAEDMPDHWKNKPLVAYFQGDLSDLKNMKPTVAIASDYIPGNERTSTDATIIASRSAVLFSELAGKDVTRSYLEDSMPFKSTPQKGDLVWLNSGHSIVTSPEQRAEREQMRKDGVNVISLNPPLGSTRYNSRLKGRELIPATGNDHTSSVTARAMAGASSSLLVLNMDQDAKTSIAREAVTAHMRQTAIGEKDDRPVFVEYSDLKQIKFAGGNIAMTKLRGVRAFEAAGLGEARTGDFAKIFDGAKPGISAGQNPKVAADAIAKRAAGKEFAVVRPVEKKKSRSDQEIY